MTFHTPRSKPCRLISFAPIQDRSLGYCELKIGDIAIQAEGEEAKEKPYKSLGKFTKEDNIKLDKGNFKGQLVYEAEFIPAIPVKNIKFQTHLNQLKRNTVSSDNTDAGTVVSDDASFSSSDEEFQAVPDVITASKPIEHGHRTHKVNASVDTTKTGLSLDTNAASPTSPTFNGSVGSPTVLSPTSPTLAAEKEEVGLDIPNEDLLDDYSTSSSLSCVFFLLTCVMQY